VYFDCLIVRARREKKYKEPINHQRRFLITPGAIKQAVKIMRLHPEQVINM